MGVKNLQNRSPGGGTPWARGLKIGKNSKNNIDPTKRGAALDPIAPIWKKMWPTWPQLGSQDGAKTEKKSIKKLMHLGINFWNDFNGF